MEKLRTRGKRFFCIFFSALLLFLELLFASVPLEVDAMGVSDTALYLWEAFMASEGYYFSTKQDYVNSFNGYQTFYNNLSSTEQKNYVSGDEFTSIPVSNTADNIIDAAGDKMAEWYLSAKAYFHDNYYRVANKLAGKETATFSSEAQIVALFSSFPLQKGAASSFSYGFDNFLDCLSKYGCLVLRSPDKNYLEYYSVYVSFRDLSEIGGYYMVLDKSNSEYPAGRYRLYSKSTNSVSSDYSVYRIDYARPYSQNYITYVKYYRLSSIDFGYSGANVVFDSFPSHVAIYAGSGQISGSYALATAVAAATSASSATLIGSGTRTFTLPDKITVGSTSAIPMTANKVLTETGTDDAEAATLAVEEAILALIGDLSEEIGDIKDVTDAASAVNASWLSKIHKALSAVQTDVAKAASQSYTVTGMSSVVDAVTSILDGVVDSVTLLEDLPAAIASSLDISFPGSIDLGDVTKTWIEALPLPIVVGINALQDIVIDIRDAVLALSGVQAFPDTIDLGSVTRTWIEALPLPITVGLDALLDAVNGIKDIVVAFPGIGDIAVDIPDIPDTWTGPLEGIRVGTDALPGIKERVDGISGALTDVLGDVITLPQDIALEMSGALAVDRDLADAAASSLSAALQNHLPDFSPIINPIKSIQFSDTYTYPKIQIKTPAVIKQFYHHDYITLFDGKNYAEHFLIARNLVRTIIWLGFAYAILRYFRVRFHIG